MDRKIKLIVIFLFMFIANACNFEVNTVDPQCSVDIRASKKDSLFLGEYQCQQIPNNIFEITEAWVENVWFNKVSHRGKIKSKTNEIQLILKLSNFRNPEFKKDKYIIDWALKDEKNNFLGQSNGIFVLFLENNKMPDSIYISICKLNHDRTTKDAKKFLITKKQ